MWLKKLFEKIKGSSVIEAVECIVAVAGSVCMGIVAYIFYTRERDSVSVAHVDRVREENKEIIEEGKNLTARIKEFLKRGKDEKSNESILNSDVIDKPFDSKGF